MLLKVRKKNESGSRLLGGVGGQKWLEKWGRRAVWDSHKIWFLDLGAGSMGPPSCENSSNCTLGTCAFFFVCILYFNKITIKIRTLSWKILVCVHIHIKGGFPGGSDGKESACNAGDLGSIPGLGRSLEKEMATLSSILAWRIPWMKEPGRLQSMLLQRVRYDWATNTHTHINGLPRWHFKRH